MPGFGFFCLYLLAVNALTFALYGLDKRAARNGAGRVSESALLSLALIGGSPAALAAKKYFRHKTRKTSFLLRYWAIVALQLAALAYWGAETYG